MHGIPKSGLKYFPFPSVFPCFVGILCHWRALNLFHRPLLWRAGTLCQGRRWKSFSQRGGRMLSLVGLCLPFCGGIFVECFCPKEMKNNELCFDFFIPDADCRGPKNQSKSIKPQSALPPRLQHTVGTRQHQFICSGPQPHQTSTEQKAPGRNSSQAVR